MSFTPASSDLAADLRKHDSGATQSALIRILTPDQAKVTASYVKRLHALASEPSGSSSTSAIAAVHRGTLLAHAYVRYLGDLSGGQHIARRIRKRWPCVASSSTSMDFVEDSEDGFEFYDFKDDEGSVENGNYTQELKDQFRDAMDQGMEYACASSAATSGSNPGTRASLNGTFSVQSEQSVTCADRYITPCYSDALVSEANVAFDLNRHLFDALVGSTLSDSIHSSSSLPTPSTAPSALGSTQMPAKDGQVRPSKAPLVACALVVLAAFYYSNGAMRSLWQMNSERLAF